MDLTANMGKGSGLTAAMGSLSLTANMGITGDANLIVDGTFDTECGVNWTCEAGWAITGGKGVATATTKNLWQNVLTIGDTYKISYEVSDYVSGTFNIFAGTNNGPTVNEDGSYEDTITCAGNTNLLISADTAFTGKIDNIIVFKQ